MKLRSFVTAAAIALLPLAARSATIIVPAAGTGPGANNSQWQSELTLHTAAPRLVTLSIELHQGTNVLGPVEVTLQPRQTLSIADIAKTQFGLSAGTGAIVITASDRDARTLAIASRTFNVSPQGEFGQDIAAINAADAHRAGETAAIPGPSIASHRFNAGVYAVESSTIAWSVLRADGSVAATKEMTLAAGQQAQYNGVIELIGAEKQANDTVHAQLTAGKAIFYGSIVNADGDPHFVPASRTRNDVLINFLGLDLDENGTVDLADADGDGVLDAPLLIYASLFPSYFQLLAESEFGEAVTFEVISSPALVELGAHGAVTVVAGGDVKGTSGEIAIRAISGDSSSILTIPVIFK